AVRFNGRGAVRLGPGHAAAALSRVMKSRRFMRLTPSSWITDYVQQVLGRVRATLKAQYEKLHKAVLAIVREDAVCRRLMTAPGVGPVVAVTFKSAVDDPSRIAKSKAVGALFGLTPKKYQSGEKDVTGGITRTGNEMVRTALYEAANVLLSRITRFSKL